MSENSTFIYVSESVSVSVGVGSQITLGSQAQPPEWTTTTDPLTTVFTAPPVCQTPFAWLNDCYGKYHCDAQYLPFLYTDSPGSPPVVCLPQTTIFSDGFTDGQYDYNPGIYCPNGLTTATSIGNQFLCCPIGMTYSFDGKYDSCAGTVTKGVFWAGPGNLNSGTIARAITLSSGDGTTIFLGAPPVWLTQNSHNYFSNPAPTSIDRPTDTIKEPTSKQTSLTSQTTTHRCWDKRDCLTTSLPTNTPGPPSPGPSLGVKVGAIVGGAVTFVLVAVAAVLLLRYRRRRLLARQDSPLTDLDADLIQQHYQKKHLPELPVVESAAELEGTHVEGHGPGIYVWKPELEGTAGLSGAKGVYVRKKSELEARYNEVFPGSPMSETRSAATTAPESPVVGPSFTRYSVPR
ncbi:hypothetical protein F5B22DRAFT_618601 [Xylaria bambusicola]|uniref:uncharacterized protein n=1 Tax=Xylaria bambusicola TaxID=326684 RepID=UPI002007F664|nr:uncharacterized protein F5B22DRAFT_618601 [Xylaria bambusicola]KAI0509137.1 hypothetical protein F5B22DRAFT_618601 [Xylaria bambusicola]